MLFGKKPALGKQAPDFTLPSAAKENVSLSEYRGRVVLLVFLRSSG